MIEIRFTKTGVLGATKTQLGDIGREAMRLVALKWWRDFLPLHFTGKAYGLYGYKPRGTKYSIAKSKQGVNGEGIRAIGQNRPLVWSGDSRERATTQPNVKGVRESYRSFRGEIAINAPTLNYVPNSSRDLRVVTPAENQELEREFGKQWEAGLNRIGRTAGQTVTIR